MTTGTLEARGQAADVDRGLLVLRDVARRTALCERSITRLHKTGKMPQPIRFGTRCLRWKPAEIEAWIEAGCPDLSQQ